jgi:hypothetical protein
MPMPSILNVHLAYSVVHAIVCTVYTIVLANGARNSAFNSAYSSLRAEAELKVLLWATLSELLAESESRALIDGVTGRDLGKERGLESRKEA